MKRIILILFILFSNLSSMRSQNWEALGEGLGWQVRAVYSDSVDNFLYATGIFLTYTPDGRKLKGIARWDGVKWDSVGNGVSAGTNTFAFARYNNDLYVGGVFDSVGYLKCKGIGVWKGNYWDTMAVQPFKNNFGSYGVLTMSVIDNELYIGGVFDTLVNAPCRSIAKWNGTNFTCLDLPQMSFTPYISSICKYNGEIYFGGNFSSPLFPSDTIQDIIRYDGVNWRSVGGGMKGGITVVSSMVVYNNELYVAGLFTKSAGNIGNYIQKWDGSSWSEVGGGVERDGGGTASVAKLLVHNNKLYAMGVFDIAGGVPAQYIAAWDGTDWCGLGSNFDNGISVGCIYDSTICIGGGFWTIDGDSMNYISKWTGGNYVDTCGHIVSGINEITNQNDFIIYPNPATSTITFESKIYQLQSFKIIDVLGREIYYLQPFSNKTEIDVSQLPSGIYILQMQSKNGVSSKKFVKK